MGTYAKYTGMTGAGSGVVSLDNLAGALTLSAGSGISISDNGLDTITIASTSAGDVTLAAFGSTPNANGLSLSSQVLNMQPASASFPGGVSTGTQSFAGNKTFTGTIAASNLSGTNTGDVTIGTASGLSLSGQALSLGLASAGVTGALSGTDWSTFNGKQAAGSYITALTGDATAAGPGSAALTLATVNANVGSFGSSTSIPSFTVNDKGLVTAASGNAVIAPASTLSGTTLASGVVTSSLTTVGTIGTGTWQGTKIDLAYGGTNADLSATGGTSQVLKQVSAGAAVTVGQLAFSDISGSVAAGQMPALTGDVTTSAGGVATTAAATQNNITSIPNLATVGTITSGVWSGTAIVIAKGGTNNASLAVTNGGMLYTDGSKVVNTGAGSNGQFMASVGAAAPIWQSFIPSWAEGFASGSTVTYNLVYAFVVSGVSVFPAVNDQYTNNGVTYTIKGSNSTANIIWAAGSAAPTTTGTLTRSSGSGDSTITFGVSRTPIALKVMLIGGGGGGSGNGSGAFGTATAGNPSIWTTFGGTTIVQAGGGGAGATSTNGGGIGGTNTINSPAVSLLNMPGRAGSAGQAEPASGVAANFLGGIGGSSIIGGGGTTNSANSSGGDGVANSGGGGGGAGSGANIGWSSGSGGGGAGSVQFYLYAPSAQYKYTIAATASGGSAGTGGSGAGGTGAAGYAAVESYYQ